MQSACLNHITFDCDLEQVGDISEHQSASKKPGETLFCFNF